MKRHKYYLRRILLLIVTILLVTININAQTTTIDAYTIWGTQGTTQNFVINQGEILIINDTLVIYGNLELKNDALITINNGGVLIIVGDFVAKNKVDLGVGGTLVVTGNFTKNGTTGEITDNGGSIYIFDDTPDWGGDPVPVDFGDENDIITDPIIDIIGEIISSGCTLSLSLDNITDVTTPASGAISITVTGNTAYTYTWSTSDGSGLIVGDEDQTGLTAGTYSVAIQGTGTGATCFVFGSYTIVEVSCINPSISTVTAPEICNGSSYDLSNVVVVDANSTSPTYTYHSASPATVGNELGSTTVNPASTTNYYILGTNGSCTDELVVNVTVNSQPVAVAITGNGTTCAGTLGDGFSVTNGAWNYAWTVEDNLGTITNQGTSSITIDWNDNAGITWLPAGTTNMVKKVTATVTDAGSGCSTVIEWNVTIYREPMTGPQYHIENAYGI